jgi:ribosomal protein S6--L-glutamate ligase
MDLRFFYVEKFIDYDRTDYRVDIVDGEYIGCYGRKAGGDDWRTNITSGGSVFLREPDDAVVDLAIRAAKVTGLEIAGVDIIYDRSKEEYIVLEVNGIPAFATPEQEKAGLDFNDRKIEKIVDLIDRKTKNR